MFGHIEEGLDVMRFYPEAADAVFGRLHPRPAGTCISEASVFLEKNPSLDLSVIIPCYNGEATLPALLTSLAAQQTRFAWEIILVDDGSTDATPEILHGFAAQQRRCRVVSKENGGAASARNAGIRVSRGRYLMFVDADDAISAGYVDGLLSAAAENGADLAACAYESHAERGALLRRAVPSGVADWGIVNGCPWGKAFRRELFAHVLFPEGYWFEDTVLAFLVYPQVKRLATTPKCTYFYRSSPGNTTQRAMRDVRSIDTVYVTDMVLNCVQQWAPATWLAGKACFQLLLEQFYLNHRRLMGLQVDCRRLLFQMQSAYLNGQYPDGRADGCASPLYARALRHRKFWMAELAVRLDKPLKLLARIRQRFCLRGKT